MKSVKAEMESTKPLIRRFTEKRFVFPIILFLTAFLPRVIYPVARSHIWHDRGIVFLNALRTGNLAETIQSPHPGIMTMWLIAGTRWLGLTWLPNLYNEGYFSQISLEIIPLALVISLLLVWAYFLLTRLFNSTAALVSTFLLALDPFHISISKTVHVDALMSVFLLLSGLYILVFISQPGESLKRPLLFSAVFGGMALLTKTPALFIVPYLLLCLLVWQVSDASLSSGSWPQRQQFIQMVKKFASSTLLWLLVVVITFVAFNPALWADPVGTLEIMFTGTTQFVQTPHPFPMLFRGEIITGDPGFLFYPINMALKTTAVVSITFIIGLSTLFMRQIRRSQRQTLWLILSFLLFFTLQMFLGDKKGARYVLPALQVLILFAGLGTTLFLQWLLPRHQKVMIGLLTLIVLTQAAISLPHHPYYGTHYNRLVGTAESILGSELVAGQEQGEGLDIAAAYLNNLPDAARSITSVQIADSFSHHYVGTSQLMPIEAADYLVFSRNWLVRNNQHPDWQEAWLIYKNRTAKHVIEFDGVPYVWIYENDPVLPVIDKDTVESWLPTQFGNQIRFLGYDYEPKIAHPQDRITLTLYWEAAQQMETNYTVFAHLLDEQGVLIAQQDNQPQSGTNPTSTWNKGERIQDRYELIVPANAADGPSTLAIGMYVLETLERLPLESDLDLIIQDSRLLLPGPVIEGDN